MSEKKKAKVLSINPEPKLEMVPVYAGGFELAPPTGAALALREAKRASDTVMTRIWKFLYEPKKNIELTEFEEELFKRLNNVWNLLTGKVLNDRKAILAHIVWCKENYMEIAERTAYDDLRRAKWLFGDPRQSTHMFEKKRMSEMLLEQIEIMRTIQNGGNTIDKIEAAKAINSLTRRYNAINGLEDDIKQHVPRPAIVIQFNSDPEVLKQQAKELMEGVEDVDYEEVD